MSFTARLWTGVQCRTKRHVWLCPLCPSHVSFLSSTIPTFLSWLSFTVEFQSFGFVTSFLWHPSSCSSILCTSYKLEVVPKGSVDSNWTFETRIYHRDILYSCCIASEDVVSGHWSQWPWVKLMTVLCFHYLVTLFPCDQKVICLVLIQCW